MYVDTDWFDLVTLQPVLEIFETVSRLGREGRVGCYETIAEVWNLIQFIGWWGGGGSGDSHLMILACEALAVFYTCSETEPLVVG